MKGHLIGLDWGSTRVRSCLIDQNGLCIEQRSTLQGVGQRTQPWTEAINDLIQGWDPDLPIYAIGMIGSNKGLCPMPYVPTSCTLQDWLSQIQSGHQNPDCIKAIGLDQAHRFFFTPGVSHQSSWILDVMRGEEMMVFGYLTDFQKEASKSSHLLCLPGTHSKWIEASSTQIRRFQTVPTGELFALLKQAPLLGQGCRKPQNKESSVDSKSVEVSKLNAFKEGVYLSQDPSDLSGHLFALRSRFLFESTLDMDAHQSFLSGLLIGHELKNPAIQDVIQQDQSRLSLMASPPLSDLYYRALQIIYPKIEVHLLDAQELFIKGVWALHSARMDVLL
jgi:2-dehydro-3-deoxygalactonokinase